MKVKELYRLCKSTHIGRIITNETTGDQWLGDGRAIYPLLNHPAISTDHLLMFMEVPEDKAANYTVTEEFASALPPDLLSDSYADERQISEYGIRINGFIPFATSHGLVFLDPDYLKPLRDIENLTFFERICSWDGRLYIAIKSGMFLFATILPETDCITTDFIETLVSMANRGRQCVILKDARAANDD